MFYKISFLICGGVAFFLNALYAMDVNDYKRSDSYLHDDRAAWKIVTQWDGKEALKLCGHDPKPSYTPSECDTVNKRISVYFQGHVNMPGNIIIRKVREHGGGDSCVGSFVSPISADYSPAHRKCLITKKSFGLTHGTIPYIYVLKKMIDADIQEIDLRSVCRGSKVMRDLFVLLVAPGDYEEDLLKAHINRLDREKILSAIRHCTAIAPFRQTSEVLATRALTVTSSGFGSEINTNNSIVNYASYATSFVSSLHQQYGLLSAQTAKNILGKVLFYTALPIYNEFDFEQDMYLQNNYEMRWLKHEIIRKNPHISFFMMTNREDDYVGNDTELKFFDCFAATDNKKHLISSPQTEHATLGYCEVAALLSSQRRFGSSFRGSPEFFELGYDMLQKAQEGQQKNIKEYIAQCYKGYENNL